jgi:hypothetical protein
MARRYRRQSRRMEKQHMRTLEQIALSRGFSGISYTHVVFPSGRVWFGRGFRKVGAHTMGYNSTGFGVAAVGNYETDKPTEALLTGIARTFRKARKWRKASKDARIRGHRDVSSTACPGKNLYAKLDQIAKKSV